MQKLLTEFLRLGNKLTPAATERLQAICSLQSIGVGELLAEQGVQSSLEIILLQGRVATSTTNADGNSVCFGLYQSQKVLPPHISRTRDGSSIHDIQTLDHCLIATIDVEHLMQEMVQNAEIREWGNAIMREQLMHQADRQWALAALDGRGRLEWFRKKHSGFEDHFEHWRIASYLGMTPVTLSRVRQQLSAKS